MEKTKVVENVRTVVVNKHTMPIFGLLAAVLTVLKLTGNIAIGWGWIIACFFTPFIIFVSVISVILIGIVIFLICTGLFILVSEFFNKPKSRF